MNHFAIALLLHCVDACIKHSREVQHGKLVTGTCTSCELLHHYIRAFPGDCFCPNMFSTCNSGSTRLLQVESLLLFYGVSTASIDDFLNVGILINLSSIVVIH